MGWIARVLGIHELTCLLKENNKHLKEVIKLQKHSINNDCEVHSRKRRA